MIVVYYENYGLALADSDVIEYVDNIIKEHADLSGGDIILCVSNELTILAFRTAVKEKKILPYEIVFKSRSSGRLQPVHVGAEGRFVTPWTFISVHDSLLDALIGL